jgi:hypothetical protein
VGLTAAVRESLWTSSPTQKMGVEDVMEDMAGLLSCAARKPLVALALRCEPGR